MGLFNEDDEEFGDSFFGDLYSYTPAGMGIELFDLTGGKASAARDRYAQSEFQRRAQQKQNQLALLGRKQAPTMSAAMESRLKALEEESKPGALVADPEFQGMRANLVTGGRQALAGVQNRQGAAGVSGGFSNTGSMQNVYDRMGAQLAQLGQKSVERKSQKADQVAQSRQAFTEAQTAHQNAMIDAQMAIEAGDAAALNDAYSRIYAAGVQADQARKAMLFGIGKTALGAVTGNPLAAADGAGDVVGGRQQMAASGYPQTVGQANGMYDSDPFSAPKQFRPGYSMLGYGGNR